MLFSAVRTNKVSIAGLYITLSIKPRSGILTDFPEINDDSTNPYEEAYAPDVTLFNLCICDTGAE